MRVEAVFRAALFVFMTLNSFSLSFGDNACDQKIDACLGSLGDLRSPDGVRRLLQRGIRDVCASLDDVVDCVEDLASSSQCRNHRTSGRHVPPNYAISMYDLICEKEIEDIEENWSCLQDIFIPLSRCTHHKGCELSELSDCADELVSSSSKCSSDVTDLVHLIIRTHLVKGRGCSDHKEECQIPANHCQIAFPGFISFQEESFLKLGPSQICGGLTDDVQCFEEMTDRADCGLSKFYFGDSYTGFIKFFDYVCEKRLTDVSTHWRCLSSVWIDIIKCTPAINSPCDVKQALQCAHDVVQRSSECQQNVSPLIRDLVQEKMKLFNECSDRL